MPKLCTARGSRKNHKLNYVETFPCGMLAEPGCEHCAVHLTQAEKLYRKEINERNDRAARRDATYGG